MAFFVSPFCSSECKDYIMYPSTRQKLKKTRLFIDNEYIERGYLAKLPKSASSVYLVLAKYANADTQTCFPGVETIRKEAGINKNYTVRAIRILEALNIITAKRIKRKSSHYTLVDSEFWKPVSSINVDTYKVVSKRSSVEYQKHEESGISLDTVNHIRKSNKEINENDSINTEGTAKNWQLKNARKTLGPDVTDEFCLQVIERAKQAGELPHLITDPAVVQKYAARITEESKNKLIN